VTYWHIHRQQREQTTERERDGPTAPWMLVTIMRMWYVTSGDVKIVALTEFVKLKINRDQ